jgi:hypothetical protein
VQRCSLHDFLRLATCCVSVLLSALRQRARSRSLPSPVQAGRPSISRSVGSVRIAAALRLVPLALHQLVRLVSGQGREMNVMQAGKASGCMPQATQSTPHRGKNAFGALGPLRCNEYQ